jgi:hypothetical protein
MKRIFVPTRDGADWQRHLAKPKLHWKSGASAMTAAASWEAAADRLPPEIAALLSQTSQPELSDLHLLVAIPEWQVELPGGQTRSATDVLALCRNTSGLCTIAVEAKVLEDFGPTVGEKRAGASPGQAERLDFLCELLGVSQFSDRTRYQLLHRTASALLTARDFHASTAVMLVQAFDTPADRMQDFERFAAQLRASPVSPGVLRVEHSQSPRLYLAWCSGDASFRKSNLPSAV